MAKVFSVGDIHFPFENKKYLKKVIKRIKEEAPDYVIQLGDLNDQYMFSKYDKKFGVILPKEELKKAKELGKKFWEDVKKAAPKAKCIQLIGNHDIRLLKQTAKKFPEIYHFIEEAHKDLYTFPGVTSYYSDRDYLVIDDVIYCHGWQASHINHFRSNVVRCHDHQAWMRVVGDNAQIFGGIISRKSYTLMRDTNLKFEISCGMFADDSKVPFGYTNSRRTDWRPAIAVITTEYAKLEVFE